MLHVQFPHMRGVVYLHGSNQTKIENCTFSGNDAGPLLSELQVVGMLNRQSHRGRDYSGSSVQRASAIFIDQRTTEVQILGCLFHSNSLDFMKDFVVKNNRDLYDFFPPDYFSSSHAPQINSHMEGPFERACSVTIANSTFRDQRNVEILGYSRPSATAPGGQPAPGLPPQAPAIDMNYYASLASARTRNPKFELRFIGNTVYNQTFIGKSTALINMSHGGILTASDNVFFDIGYLSTQQTWISLPYNFEDKTREFPFHRERVSRGQAVGVFRMGNVLHQPGMVNSFTRNRFRKIYAQRAGIYSIEVANYRDIRMHMDGNHYYEVFGEEAAIIHLQHRQASGSNDEVLFGSLAFLADNP